MTDVCYEMLMWDMPLNEMAAMLKDMADINVPDDYGDYILTVACQQLRPEIVRMLIEKGANVNCQNLETDTPLICVIDYAHHNPPAAYEIAKMLLDAGGDIELRGYMDKTPFLKACSRGCLDILKLLVSTGCDINAVCTDMGGSVDGRELSLIFETSTEFRKYLKSLY